METMYVSKRSVLLAAVLARTLRPLADRMAAEGLQLRAFRAAVAIGALPSAVAGRGEPVDLGDTRCLWVRARPRAASDDVVLYVHGGGLVFGSARTHRALARRLAGVSRTDVLLVDYRLAPEHPYPAAVDDVLSAYRALLDLGYASHRIVVVGDSVGGYLTAALLNDLLRLGLPLPAAVALMSPALDVTGAGALKRDMLRRDPFLAPAYGLRCARAYLAGASPDTPRVRVLDGDKSGWPPVLVQVGGTECLLADAERLADALRAAGGRCDVQTWRGQVHVFQAFALLPEAREAIRSAGSWIRDQLDAYPDILDQEKRHA